MTNKKTSLWRIYAFSTTVSLLLFAFVGFKAGLAGLILVIILAGLEITFSFDNAVINAKILRKMSHAWQQAFLTVGILIAVFGVRLILPIAIVAGASGLSLGGVVDLALNDPDQYGHHLEEAHPIIAGFGGMFLLMIFLDFMFQDRKIKWLKKPEKILARAGKLESLSVILALGILLGVSSLAGGHDQEMIVKAGLIGLLVYLIINSLDVLLLKSGIESNLNKASKATFKAGLIGFIYLEIIDASFSLDGVIGAFAITNQILIIAVGLGIGALYVRTLTVHMLRRQVLEQYHYMEHGAHYAIGILAGIMLISIKFEVPEVVTGLAGVVVIATAIIHSRIEAKQKHKKPLI